MGSKIVVVGSVNTDMVVKGRRLPRPGETVIGGEFVMVPGGKGANQAVAAARLGTEVTLVAKVGEDLLGKQAVENYRRERINVDLILRDPATHTGVALILVDSAGENLISVASGANAALSPADVDRAADCIAEADLLMLQLEIPLASVCRAAEIAAKAAVPVILDPAPATPLPRELLERTTFLTPNEQEAEQLTGIAVRDEASARRAAKQLRDGGARNVLVTLGGKGALLATAERDTLFPAPTVDAVDSTAAGDAFNGGLAWALSRGVPVEEAVRQACLVGALATTRIGAQSSLPTLEEFNRFASSIAK